MGYLPDPKTTTIFVTASTILLNGRRRNIILETRPEFAVVHLHGSKEHYPLAWETIFEAAVMRDKRNRKLEKKTKDPSLIVGAPVTSETQIAKAGSPPKKCATSPATRKLRLA